MWQCDHTPADVLLVDSEGTLLGRPWLTTVIDSYSRCIVGINLGFDAPSSQVVSTRFQRWESGLIAMPKLLSERELDICLMKQARRQIQRGGYLQFENLMYRGENLGGYGGESVVVRFDPRDITTILIYCRDGENEVFLARAQAQDLETEELSLDEAKAMSRKIREKGKEVTNRS